MNDHDRLQRSVTTLQETVAFQQRTIDDLNEVVVEMRSELDRLQKIAVLQKSRIEWLSASVASDADPNEKPPHY